MFSLLARSKGKKTTLETETKSSVVFDRPKSTSVVRKRRHTRAPRQVVRGREEFLRLAPNRLELIRGGIATNSAVAVFIKGKTSGSCFLVYVDIVSKSQILSWEESAKSNGYTDVTKVLLDKAEFDDVIEQANRDALETSGTIETQNEALRNWSAIMDEAILNGTSDIHIFADPDSECSIHFRIDGRLVYQSKFERLTFIQLKEAVQSAWNQNDRNLQTGSEKNWSTNKKVDTIFTHTTQSVQYDLRFQQTAHGKQNGALSGFYICIRVTSKASGDDFISLDTAGYSDYTLYWIKRALNRSAGLVLVAGTTGSGKSTSALGMVVNYKETHPQLSVQTIEDPVESVLGRSIPQMSVPAATEDNPTPHLDAVKAKLRQDPDAIYAGEIQGAEMAQVTTKAAITGHLVIATIHSSNSISIVGRVVTEGGSLASLLTPGCYDVGVTQKLFTKPCPECSRSLSRQDDPSLYDELKFVLGHHVDGVRVAVPESDCEYCKGTGYKGRILTDECLPITNEVRECYLKSDTSGIFDAWFNASVNEVSDGYYGRTIDDRAIFLASKGLICAHDLHLHLGGDLYKLEPSNPKSVGLSENRFGYIFGETQSTPENSIVRKAANA